MQAPPGPRGRKAWGFFGKGNSAGTLRFLEQTARTYGPLSSFRILGKRIYLVNDSELIKEILVTRQHEFVRDTGATLLRELVGDGLITREEPEHKERRRVLQPAFHRDQVASYAEAMVRETNRVATEWTDQTIIDMRREMKRLTLAIVGATLFGTDFRDSADAVAAVLQRVVKKSTILGPAFAFIEPAALFYRRMLPRGPSLFFRTERAQLENIIAPLIERSRAASSTTSSKDILSLVLASKEQGERPLTNEEIRNEIVTFVLAGHETTASALTWTWYLLAQHLAVEERMNTEVDQVVGERDVTFEDLPRLKYTSQVFQEAMRLYPPAVAFARRPRIDLDLGGYRIKRGSSVFISPYITQRDEHYFERPEAFAPERWNAAAPPKFAYFPFGGGAKMCIGEPFARMEGVLVLAAIARRWRFQKATGSMEMNVGITLTPSQPVLMTALSRTGTANESVYVRSRRLARKSF